MRMPPNARGFSLIELLLVVSIVALLMAILLPSMARARAGFSAPFRAHIMNGWVSALLWAYQRPNGLAPLFLER